MKASMALQDILGRQLGQNSLIGVIYDALERSLSVARIALLNTPITSAPCKKYFFMNLLANGFYCERSAQSYDE